MSAFLFIVYWIGSTNCQPNWLRTTPCLKKTVPVLFWE